MRASLVAARSSFESTSPRTPGSRVKRRMRRTPSARSAFRSARPTNRSPASRGKDVVAVRALVLALVHLDHVPEAEEALEQRPVPDEVVERADEHRWRGRAVELGVGKRVERRAAVVDVDLAQPAFRDERDEVVMQAGLAALQPPVLPDRGLGQGAPRTDGEQRERAQRLVLRRRRRPPAAASGSHARPGRSAAESSGGRRSRAGRCPRAHRAPPWPASSSTCRRCRLAPRSRASRAALRAGSARARARRGPHGP